MTTDNQELQLTEVENVDGLSIAENRSVFLANIKKADLLTPELMNIVTTLAPELGHVFRTQTVWRTETEIRCSVLNDMSFPDNASKYHQAKLEQLVFFEQLLHLSFEFRTLKEDLNIIEADIEELEYKLENDDLKSFEVKTLNAELNKKRIDMEEKALGIQHHQIQARERIREVEIWSRIKDELDDGSFDKDTKDTNQLISMTRRYIQEAWNAMHVGKGGDISSYSNITAQFFKLIKECLIRGLFEEVMTPWGGPGNHIFDWVCKECGVQITST
jgi:hypothetical protein